MLPALLLLAANWPQFRGPNGTAIAPADAAPPIDFKRAVWKQNLPAGHSSPVVWGERIFLAAFDGSKKLELVCLYAKDGKILWRRGATAEQIEETHVVSNPATATPAVDADRVYAYFSSYGVMAFDHSGSRQWSLPLAMPKTHHGSGASPILAGDLLIINHDAMQGGYLLAIDRRTGKQVWKTDYTLGRLESYSTPEVWHDQLVLHRQGVIEAYAIVDGRLRWKIAENTSGASTPAVSDEMIFTSTWNVLGEEDQRAPLPDFASLLKKYDKNGDGKLSETEFPADLLYTARPELESIPNSQNFVQFRSADRNKDGMLDAEEWTAFLSRVSGMIQDHGVLALKPSGATAEVVWRENTAVPEVPSPLLYKGRLFLIRNGGILTCLDAASGKVLYRSRIGAPGAYYASPIAAAGRVYLASSEGVVTVLSASSEKLEVLARNDLGEEIVATPAIAGNRIYVRSRQSLAAFEAR